MENLCINNCTELVVTEGLSKGMVEFLLGFGWISFILTIIFVIGFIVWSIMDFRELKRKHAYLYDDVESLEKDVERLEKKVFPEKEDQEK